MITFAQRRLRNTLISGLFFALAIVVYTVYRDSHARPEFLSGWTLLILVFLLAAYHIRKRLSMLDLSPAASWLQLHIYLGFGAVLAFALHVGPRWPDGLIESMLFAAFVLTAGSGIVGLYLSRRLPRRLTRQGEEVIYERIPAFISQLRDESEALVIDAAQRTGSSTLADFYRDELAPYFAGPRHFWAHLLGSGKPIFMLSQRLNALQRYLGADEREAHAQLVVLLDQKNDLDFHYAVQTLLKRWTILHVPATAAMLILVLVHVLLVYAFTA